MKRRPSAEPGAQDTFAERMLGWSLMYHSRVGAVGSQPRFSDMCLSGPRAAWATVGLPHIGTLSSLQDLGY